MKRNEIVMFAYLVTLILISAWMIGKIRKRQQRIIVVYDPAALQQWDVLRQATDITREAAQE